MSPHLSPPSPCACLISPLDRPAPQVPPGRQLAAASPAGRPPPSAGPRRPPPDPPTRESAARAGSPRGRRDIQPRPHRRRAPCIGPAPSRPRAPCPSVPQRPSASAAVSPASGLARFASTHTPRPGLGGRMPCNRSRAGNVLPGAGLTMEVVRARLPLPYRVGHRFTRADPLRAPLVKFNVDSTSVPEPAWPSAPVRPARRAPSICGRAAGQLASSTPPAHHRLPLLLFYLLPPGQPCLTEPPPSLRAEFAKPDTSTTTVKTPKANTSTGEPPSTLGTGPRGPPRHHPSKRPALPDPLMGRY